MVMTRHMCKVEEQKRKARTPERRDMRSKIRRKRQQVLRESLKMLRDGVLKFQQDLENAHKAYERGMEGIYILNTSRARRAALAGGAPQGAIPTNK